MALTHTYTYVTLGVSAAVYDEIAEKLREAGYDHVFNEGAIDMNGLALVRGAEPAEANEDCCEEWPEAEGNA